MQHEGQALGKKLCSRNAVLLLCKRGDDLGGSRRVYNYLKFSVSYSHRQ
jgi:hypothetical protein